VDSPSASEETYLRAALQAAHRARDFLRDMEEAAERLAPQRLANLAGEIEAAHGEPLRHARREIDGAPSPAALRPFADRFATALVHVDAAFERFTSIGVEPLPHAIGAVLEALHHCAQAQEALYGLRRALPPFADYWTLSDVVVDDSAAAAEGDPPTGIVHVSTGGHHGGFSLYVPENYAPERAWPVIVALHGGSGNGRDFLWSWLREARSSGYLLVAPTARAETWSEADDRGLLQILSWLGRTYCIAADRILLTGISDGATFTLLFGLAHPAVYRALAPLCGVLHPANRSVGNLDRARGVPIYLAHGALDFLFPVALARFARDTLRAAGADLLYRELADLSHTYPRSENVRILRWFESLPPRPAVA
jgi:phospholipase/carboxylesterase